MLDATQQEIVNSHSGTILVKAGPGAGKTRVVSERVISLISAGVDPLKIIVITFTREAAREVQNRIETAYPRSGVWVSTIHSLGHHILKQLGLFKYKLLSEDEAYEYVKSFYCEPGCIPCACEWVVVKEKDIQDSKTFTDILIAAGFELG